MTAKELKQDVYFLVNRSMKSSTFSFNRKGRDTGMSSNSIVAIAYGVHKLEEQYFPSDISDMMSCERMWKKLPAHRKTGDAKKAMREARKIDYHGKIKKP